MVNTPESLSLALAVGAFKPRKAKGTRLECPVGVGAQERLDVWLTRLPCSLARIQFAFTGTTYSLDDLLRLTLAQYPFENRDKHFWVCGLRVPIHPECTIQAVQSWDELLRGLLRNGTEGTLSGQCHRREVLGEALAHGNREITSPAETFLVDPNILVWNWVNIDCIRRYLMARRCRLLLILIGGVLPHSFIKPPRKIGT